MTGALLIFAVGVVAGVVLGYAFGYHAGVNDERRDRVSRSNVVHVTNVRDVLNCHERREW